MKGTRKLYVTILKALPAATLSFFSGTSLAILVNYLTGSESEYRMLIVFIGMIFGLSTYILLRIRKSADRFFQRYMATPGANLDNSWEKACAPSDTKLVLS